MSARTITVEHYGKTYSGEIMQITRTMLGTEDHGIFTAYLQCEGDGSRIAVGGYGLDRPVKDADGKFIRREGSGFGLDHLLRLMETIGISKWEDLPGQSIIVLYEGTGAIWGGSSVGIAGLTNGRVLILAEHADQWRAEHPEPSEVSS